MASLGNQNLKSGFLENGRRIGGDIIERELYTLQLKNIQCFFFISLWTCSRLYSGRFSFGVQLDKSNQEIVAGLTFVIQYLITLTPSEVPLQIFHINQRFWLLRFWSMRVPEEKCRHELGRPPTRHRFKWGYSFK